MAGHYSCCSYNVFKYPFFRFGAEYTVDTAKPWSKAMPKRKNLISDFLVLNVFSAMVNTAGVAGPAQPSSLSAFPMIGLSITQWSLILAVIWATVTICG